MATDKTKQYRVLVLRTPPAFTNDPLNYQVAVKPRIHTTDFFRIIEAKSRLPYMVRLYQEEYELLLRDFTVANFLATCHQLRSELTFNIYEDNETTHEQLQQWAANVEVDITDTIWQPLVYCKYRAELEDLVDKCHKNGVKVDSDEVSTLKPHWQYVLEYDASLDWLSIREVLEGEKVVEPWFETVLKKYIPGSNKKRRTKKEEKREKLEVSNPFALLD